MSDFITLTRNQIDGIHDAAPAEEHGYRLVSSDDTGEEWRHGHRELTVVTADGESFYAIERRIPLDEPSDWDCRNQAGSEYRLHRVVPVEIVKTVYRRPPVSHSDTTDGSGS